MTTGSQGAGLGVGGTFFLLLLGLGIYLLVQRSKKARLLKKTMSATSTDPNTATTTNTTTRDRFAAASALEMGTVEGNTHQLSTAENAHELDAPDKLHEMGDLAPEYGAEGDIHVEGDLGAEEDIHSQGEGYPEGDHGKYGNEKGAIRGCGGDEKQAAGAKPVAELEGDVAFPDRLGRGVGQGVQREGKEGVGRGFVLTD